MDHADTTTSGAPRADHWHDVEATAGRGTSNNDDAEAADLEEDASPDAWLTMPAWFFRSEAIATAADRSPHPGRPASKSMFDLLVRVAAEPGADTSPAAPAAISLAPPVVMSSPLFTPTTTVPEPPRWLHFYIKMRLPYDVSTHTAATQELRHFILGHFGTRAKLAVLPRCRYASYDTVHRSLLRDAEDSNRRSAFSPALVTIYDRSVSPWWLLVPRIPLVIVNAEPIVRLGEHLPWLERCVDSVPYVLGTFGLTIFTVVCATPFGRGLRVPGWALCALLTLATAMTLGIASQIRPAYLRLLLTLFDFWLLGIASLAVVAANVSLGWGEQPLYVTLPHSVLALTFAFTVLCVDTLLPRRQRKKGAAHRKSAVGDVPSPLHAVASAEAEDEPTGRGSLTVMNDGSPTNLGSPTGGSAGVDDDDDDGTVYRRSVKGTIMAIVAVYWAAMFCLWRFEFRTAQGQTVKLFGGLQIHVATVAQMGASTAAIFFSKLAFRYLVKRYDAGLLRFHSFLMEDDYLANNLGRHDQGTAGAIAARGNRMNKGRAPYGSTARVTEDGDTATASAAPLIGSSTREFGQDPGVMEPLLQALTSASLTSAPLIGCSLAAINNSPGHPHAAAAVCAYQHAPFPSHIPIDFAEPSPATSSNYFHADDHAAEGGGRRGLRSTLLSIGGGLGPSFTSLQLSNSVVGAAYHVGGDNSRVGSSWTPGDPVAGKDEHPVQSCCGAGCSHFHVHPMLAMLALGTVPIRPTERSAAGSVFRSDYVLPTEAEAKHLIRMGAERSSTSYRVRFVTPALSSAMGSAVQSNVRASLDRPPEPLPTSATPSGELLAPSSESSKAFLKRPSSSAIVFVPVRLVHSFPVRQTFLAGCLRFPSTRRSVTLHHRIFLLGSVGVLRIVCAIFLIITTASKATITPVNNAPHDSWATPSSASPTSEPRDIQDDALVRCYVCCKYLITLLTILSFGGMCRNAAKELIACLDTWFVLFQILVVGLTEVVLLSLTISSALDKAIHYTAAAPMHLSVAAWMCLMDALPAPLRNEAKGGLGRHHPRQAAPAKSLGDAGFKSGVAGSAEADPVPNGARLAWRRAKGLLCVLVAIASVLDIVCWQYFINGDERGDRRVDLYLLYVDVASFAQTANVLLLVLLMKYAVQYLVHGVDVVNITFGALFDRNVADRAL